MKRLIFPGVLGVAIYFAVAGGEYSVLELRRGEAELKLRRAELPVVRRQIDSLRARIDSLRHHDEALERFARERYGFIRDGELLYRFSETPAEEDEDAEADDEPRRPSVLDRLRGARRDEGAEGEEGPRGGENLGREDAGPVEREPS